MQWSGSKGGRGEHGELLREQPTKAGRREVEVRIQSLEVGTRLAVFAVNLFLSVDKVEVRDAREAFLVGAWRDWLEVTSTMEGGRVQRKLD